MKIRINGEEQEFGGGTLLSLVESKGLDPGRVVIEHNLKAAPKDKWSNIALKDDDKVEIISFVGGG